MTVVPLGPVSHGLAEGRTVHLVFDRPSPRRRWPVKRFVVLGVCLFAGGCWV